MTIALMFAVLSIGPAATLVFAGIIARKGSIDFIPFLACGVAMWALGFLGCMIAYHG